MNVVDRRQFLKQAEYVLSAGAVAGMAGPAQAASIVALLPGESVQAAIDAITDASPTNRYLIRVPAGEYAPWRMQPYISVQGAGLATIVYTNQQQAVQINSDVQVSDMRIVYVDDTPGYGLHGAIEKPDLRCNNVWLSNLEIEVSASAAAADRYGIYLDLNFVSVFVRDVNIFTRSGGVYLGSGGKLVAQGSNVYLIGEDIPGDAGVNHYGLVLRSGGRVRWFGGHITCGYSHAVTPNPQESNHDVVCVYIPADNTAAAARVDLFGVWIYAHNTASSIGGRFNTTRAENGWIRRYNCAEQAENPNTIPSWSAKAAFGAFNTALQPEQGIGGVNQVFGGRTSGEADGNVGGQLIVLDGVDPEAPRLDEGDNGIVQLDSSAGPFTVNLASGNRGIGQALTFANHPDGHPVTLDAGDGTRIMPRGSRLVELRPGEVCSLRRITRDRWIELQDRPVLSQQGSARRIGMTGSDVVAGTWTVPGGVLGEHGAFSLDLLLDVAGAADRVQAKLSVNGQRVLLQMIDASSRWARLGWIFCNQGDTAQQHSGAYFDTTQGVEDTHSGIQTDNDVVVKLKLQGMASDDVVLSWHRLEILR